MNQPVDPDLVDLIDALVEAVDASRWDEIARLRDALAPLGAVELFDAELRLNGHASAEHACCFGECVDDLIDA